MDAQQMLQGLADDIPAVVPARALKLLWSVTRLQAE
jgi:hypothetical protein